MICPHCLRDFDSEKGVEKGGKKGGEKGGEFEVLKGGYSSPDPRQREISDIGSEKRIPPKLPKRGKAREYTQAFEVAWKSYGRKEEKGQAFVAWLVASGEVGGEDQLLATVLNALSWQGENWGLDGWRFAPYFERYLKKRRWEDEPLPLPTAAPRSLGKMANNEAIAMEVMRRKGIV